jgi:tetratricopeptide (TPR) repeat protein
MDGDQQGAPGEWKKPENFDQIVQQARELYKQVRHSDPQYHEAAYACANAMWSQALTKTGEEAHALFAKSEEKYLQALDMKPDYFDAAYQCGRLLHARAKKAKGAEQNEFFDRAYAMFDRAIAMRPEETTVVEL